MTTLIETSASPAAAEAAKGLCGVRRTCTIAEAAAALGIGRNQGYEAAHRGEIATIKIGKRLLVPLAWLEKKLSGAA